MLWDKNVMRISGIPNVPQGDEQMVPGPSSPASGERYHDSPLDSGSGSGSEPQEDSEENSEEDSEPQDSDQQDSDSQLARLAQEEGVGLMNYLLAKAVADNKPLLNMSSPREWTFRDILRMPNKLQEEWKKPCLEELESLRKQQVFELTDLPHGHKAIKNRWVFDIKTDG